MRVAPWAEVLDDARRMAGGLRAARAVQPGELVGAVLTNTPLAVRGLLALWMAGGAVASLPVPARGLQLDEYVAQVRAMCGAAQVRTLLTDANLLALLPAKLQQELGASPWERYLESSALVDVQPPPLDSLAFVQYSSGSTSTPKGCALTARAIGAQLSIILRVSDAVPGRETVASWLPLSHDMGLFGCLLFSWAYDLDLVLSTPERFTMAPRTWFADMAEHGATMTAGTNTGLAAAVRARRSGLGRPLELRTAFIGAERVEWSTLAATTAAFEDDGLQPSALMPAYGLAEATLAVTAKPPQERPRFLAVDTLALADGVVVQVAPAAPGATVLTSCGIPCSGVTIDLGEGDRLSEVVVSSPSLATGYYRDPVRTAERFTSSGFRSGDLGFTHDGQLYLVGRGDDVLSVGGRKIYAREIELAVDALAPVRRGCSTVLDMHDGTATRLVLVTELRGADPPYDAVADAAADIATAKGGVVLHSCLFLSPGTLPKTPSGKIQRYRCRQLLLSDGLEVAARVRLGSDR